MTTHTLTRFEHDLVSYLNCKDAHAVALADELVDLGINTIDHFEEAVCLINSEYTSRPEADFAEEYLSDLLPDIPNYIVIDWQATWDSALRHDFTHISIDECDYFILNM